MKWYFAVSEKTLINSNVLDRSFSDPIGLLQVSIYTALKNTLLRPILLYEGENEQLLSGLDFGNKINIIKYKLSFGNEILSFAKDENYIQTAMAAYARVDIPIIEKEDEYVLYTDWDVMFKSLPNLSSLKPKLFAACGQEVATDLADLNSGVMILNIPAMRKIHEDFVNFISNNLDVIKGYDQEMMRAFFGQQYDQLDEKMNWKPYWGVNKEANIVHFHGPKPCIARRIIDDPSPLCWPTHKHLFDKDPDAYKFYLSEWDNYHSKYLIKS